MSTRVENYSLAAALVVRSLCVTLSETEDVADPEVTEDSRECWY